MAQLRLPQTRPLPALQYVRAPAPIHFPVEEEMPEGFAHLVVRTFLFRLLSFALGAAHTVASDQFVFWNASDPKRRLAPDVFVRLNHPIAPILWALTAEHGFIVIRLTFPPDDCRAKSPSKFGLEH